MKEPKEIKVTPFYYDYVLAQPYKVIIQVGGRFSSKSYNSEIEMAANLGSKENYKLLVIEDLDTGLVNGYFAGLKDKIEKFGHDKAYNMTRSPVRISNTINKNEAIFSGFASEQQKKAVKAIDQVTAILVEEGEWLSYEDFVRLLHQLRGGKPEDRKLTILMNPVDPNSFVNEKFIESTPDKVIEYFPNSKRPKVFEKDIVTTFEYEGQTITDRTTVLIALSTHHDNPYLTIDQRASIENLKDTDPELYSQLGEAKFIRKAGTYFKEFSKDIHVVDPFPIPSDWNRYTAMDYGLDMLAHYWIAMDTQGNAYVYKELYESDLIISAAAEKTKELEIEKVRLRHAPPDLWNRRQETGKSAEEIFFENGLTLTKACNNRIQGWYNVKEWLKPYETKCEQTGKTIITARLKIFSNCANLIRTLPQLQRDDKDPNDVATEPHELTHAPDALRYFLADRPVPTRIPKKTYDDDDDDEDDNHKTSKNQFYG